MSICISCHITLYSHSESVCHFIFSSYQRSLSFSDCSLVLGRWAARRRRHRPHQLRARGRRTILAAPSPRSSAPRMRDRTPTSDVGRLHSGRPTRAFIFALARRGTIARCLAASTLLDRHASLGRHVAPHCSAHFVYLCVFLSVSFLVTPTPIWPHFGVGRLHTLYPVNREAVPLVHIFCFVFFFSHTPLSFERESRQKRFSYSATREAAKWGSVKTVPGSRFSCNRRVFLRRPLLQKRLHSLSNMYNPFQ